MLKKVTTIITLLIFLFSYSTNLYAVPKCTCSQDRVLKLQTPPLYGEDIKEIQIQLNRMGYYTHDINGIYDKTTAEAAKQFQRSYNLVADGIFGIKSMTMLAEIFESPAYNPNTEDPEGEIYIIINSLERRLTVMSDGKPFKSFPVAVGTFETPTPIGAFKIIQKSSWGEGFGARWMRLNVPWGIYGIHGTNKPWSIGGFESHGCIRMHNNHVKQVYNWIDVGTKVYIVGGVDGPFTFGLRPLSTGSKGSDVVEVQKRLAGFGLYNGNFDGIYGSGTAQAVRKFQKDNGLKITGSVNMATYEKLGIQLFE
ncbi:MAG: L,D-transpeptidase family protein [Thermoanaerobacterales bacterium]|jgi:peptidoglycan hydrolase-like protein with peptidoglycan-binding domain|nr:L,D-transpeptidase family protein [Thermoanaerobacterales bacterium]